MDEEKEDDQFFQNYESTILKPIKPLDAMLKNLADGETDKADLVSFADTLSHNAEVSNRAGFEIIANMHKIVAKALKLITNNVLTADKESVESMRACLIVIVAVVRGKEVNITNYLNRAEEFGEQIDNLKSRKTHRNDFICGDYGWRSRLQVLAKKQKENTETTAEYIWSEYYDTGNCKKIKRDRCRRKYFCNY